MTSDSLVVTRRFAVPADVVFDAWVTPERFADWFGGRDATVPVDGVRIDPRVGGQWSAIMHLPGDLTMQWGGEYAAVDRPRRLAFTMSDEPGVPAGDPITVEFADADGGTQMTLRQTGTAEFTQEQYELTLAGYATYFDALEATLAAVR